MDPALQVFLDFSLPNATTWFYFSWLLAIALFFKFGRLLSIRNGDVLAVFLLVPGLLIIQSSRERPAGPAEPAAIHPAVQVVDLLGQAATGTQGTPGAVLWLGHSQARQASASRNWLGWGYLWLMGGSACFLLRCLFDLTLVQRPALAPNLNFAGLFWLAGALMVCLTAVALRAPGPSDPARNSASPGWGLGNEVSSGGPRTIRPWGQEAGGTIGPESAFLGQLRKRLGAQYWLARVFAILGHLVVVVGLILIGRWHFQDVTAGMAAATFYLMLPYTGLYIGQAHHVWPMALVVWALVSYRLPLLAGAFLGLAAGTMYFPIALLPLWLGFYWQRGAGRFLSAFVCSAGACLAVIGFILWLQNDLDVSIREALGQAAWQPWRVPTTASFWTTTLGPTALWAYRIPVFIAYAAFVLLTAVWPWPKNLAHVMALSAAVLIGIQFWYADQGGVYVLWYLPLLLLLVFRPNLEDRRPLPIDSQTDWLARLARTLARAVGRTSGWLARWILGADEAKQTTAL